MGKMPRCRAGPYEGTGKGLDSPTTLMPADVAHHTEGPQDAEHCPGRRLTLEVWFAHLTFAQSMALLHPMAQPDNDQKSADEGHHHPARAGRISQRTRNQQRWSV
eukprot:gene7445-biopygen7878